jgi:hypothetical protein
MAGADEIGSYDSIDSDGYSPEINGTWALDGCYAQGA